MSNLKDINELYEFLERESYQFIHLTEIGDLFKQIRDSYLERGEEDSAQKAQWEIDFFEFTARGNELIAKFIFKDENDEEIGYPDLINFNDSTYEYLLERFNSTNHPVLKARYSHILWLSPRKHNNYANEAIKNYLEICDECRKNDLENPKGRYGHGVLESISSAFGISIKSQMQVDNVKPKLLNLLRDFNRESRMWNRLRYELINLALENKRHFTSVELKEIAKICSDTASFYSTRNNWHDAIRFFKLGQIIDQKLSINTGNWVFSLAEANERLMEQRDKDPMAAVFFGEKSLGYYKQLKNTCKVKEIEQKIELLSQNMEFQTVSTKIDLNLHLDWCKDIARKLTCKSTDEIIMILARDDGLLPDYEQIRQMAEDMKTEAPLMFLAAESVMDERRHTVQHIVSKEEKIISELNSQYKFYLEMDKIHLIHSIIYHSYNAGKLDSKKICTFLQDNSWLGNSLRKTISKDDYYEYKWIDQLKYGFEDYFNCLQRFIANGESTYKPLLAIDSLTLKIEGIIRDICQLNGIETIYTTRDRKGRILTFEKYIQQLIYDPKLIDILGVSTVTFLKVLLVEKLGYNLRHKIAHSLMNLEGYDLSIGHLLLIAILRLSFFNCASNNKPDSP